MTTNKKGILLAILAAALYAINAPFSKILLNSIPATLMAGFLYLGAGICMLFILLLRKCKKTTRPENKLSKEDLPYTILMILLDIAAPIFLMIGLSMTTAANTSLLNNFEIVTTAVIALSIFKEKICSRLWIGIAFITVACILLSFENNSSLHFSIGSLFVLFATICWGFENNCTRKLSDKDPLEIVLLKGIFSGSGSLLIGLLLGERTYSLTAILCTLLIGSIAYGMSIFVYIYAQRTIGAARTSAYYAISPFISSTLSLLIFREMPKIAFIIAIVFMIIGAWLTSSDKPSFKNTKAN
jgi:Permeases of the drug/metabolite transporter (DMT) superfamily